MEIREEEMKIFAIVVVMLKTTAKFILLSLPSLHVFCDSVISRQDGLKCHTIPVQIHTLKMEWITNITLYGEEIKESSGLKGKSMLLYVYMNKCICFCVYVAR